MATLRRAFQRFEWRSRIHWMFQKKKFVCFFSLTIFSSSSFRQLPLWWDSFVDTVPKCSSSVATHCYRVLGSRDAIVVVHVPKNVPVLERAAQFLMELLSNWAVPSFTEFFLTIDRFFRCIESVCSKECSSTLSTWSSRKLGKTNSNQVQTRLKEKRVEMTSRFEGNLTTWNLRNDETPNREKNRAHKLME